MTQGGESSGQPPTTPTAPTAGPDVGVSNPLGSLINPVADAANQAAEAQTTAPVQTPEQAAFVGQFDPVQSTMSAAESGPAAVNPTSPDLASVLGGLDAASTQAPASVSDVMPPAETPAPEVTAAPKPEEAQIDAKGKFMAKVEAAVDSLWDDLKAQQAQEIKRQADF